MHKGYKNNMQVTSRSRLQLRIQYVIFIALFISCIGLLAWLSTQYTFRSDWTAGKRNSLAEDTVKLLTQLDGEINIRSYQPDDPTTRQAVEEILERYKHHNKNLHFRILNPDLEIDLAKADSINSYGQTVIKYNDKQELLNSLNEQSMTNALIRLSRTSKPVITFIQGHNERNPDETTNTGYSTFKNKLMEKGFSVQSINLLQHKLTTDIKLLALAAPNHKLLAGEVEQLVNFINQGGNLLWLQDPGDLQNLETLAERLQITFLQGILVDNNPSLRETLRIQHPAVIPIISYGKHKITEEMRYNTLFQIASALDFAKDSAWTTTPLLITLPESWTETDGFALEVKFEEDKGDIAGPHTPGLALERTLETKKSQRLVVIGDSDFLANTYIGAGANLTFGLNIANWLNTDDSLIAINPKSAPDLSLKLTDTEIAIIGLGFMVFLPLSLTGIGIFIWHKRRNR